MDREQVWSVIDAQRIAVADLLLDLSGDEWRTPSLCAGWTVGDVAAHLAWQQLAPLSGLVGGLIRARGNMDRLIRDAAPRYGRSRSPERLAAEIRGLAGTRKHPPGLSHREVLIDILVHPQDIAVPLGRSHPMPAEAAAVAATAVWKMDKPFRAASRFAGRRLVATDTDWSAGGGDVLERPMRELLLIMTGRRTGVRRSPG
jgi:uncharacterized protein (TIGR03083 family)